MRACLDLLVKYNYIQSEGKTLRQIYEDTIGIYKIERNAPEIWNMIHEHKVENLFQMEQQSGIKGIALTKPQSVEELASINSIMRLMVSEKGALQPLDIFSMRKKNPALWEREMINYGLSEEERQWLHSWLDASYGICETQETLMSMLQDPIIGGHSLLFADRVRKSIAKKKPEEFLKCQQEFYETIEEKKLSSTLAHYTWDVIFAASRGYSFCMAHTLAYSLVGLQEMNLAYKYPIIFWNTANLIVDSGAMNLEDEINFDDEEDEEQEKVKNSSMDYGKVAAAIGKMKVQGLSFSLPNINKSDLTFSPDLENNRILYGIRGITRIGNQLIKEIIKNRPYTSIEDFLSKVKVNKPQMINLIKSGAFDELYDLAREDIMNLYLDLIADKKKRITLQNMQMLIAKGLIPEELDFERRLFNFNKYLKKFKSGDYYTLDVIAATFFNNNYDESLLTDIQVSDDDYSAKILQSKWDNIYKKGMEPVRVWMKENQEQILNDLNKSLFEDAAEKYTEGTISKWEMDSLSFYYHEHELAKLRADIYGISDYFNLPEEPQVERTFTTKDGNEITLFKVVRIAGTVIDKNKNKSMVTLLTPTGVVTVKVWKNQFAKWDKQISERDNDGVKHVIEKSWFTRGNKLIITGIRRDDTFIPKKYKGTEYPLFERIDKLDENGWILESVTERADEGDE